MIDGGLWAGGKLNRIGTMPKVVVKERVSARTLNWNGLPDASAAVPEELFYCARVGLQGA